MPSTTAALLLAGFVAATSMIGGLGDFVPPSFVPPTVWPSYEHAYDWAPERPDSTFLAAKFRLHNESAYEFHVVTDGVWSETVAAWDIGLLLNWTFPREFVAAEGVATSQNSCRNRELEGDPDSCAPMDMESRGGGFGSSLNPGTYVFLAATYGADRAELGITATFASPIEVLWVDEGRATLVAPDIVGEPPGLQRARVEDLEFTLGSRALVEARTATTSNRAQDVAFVCDGLPCETFRRQLPDVEMPAFWHDDQGRLVPHAAIGLAAGDHRVQIHLPDSDYPLIPILGILESPRFVSADGTLDALGPGVFAEDAWLEESLYPPDMRMVIGTAVREQEASG